MQTFERTFYLGHPMRRSESTPADVTFSNGRILKNTLKSTPQLHFSHKVKMFTSGVSVTSEYRGGFSSFSSCRGGGH